MGAQRRHGSAKGGTAATVSDSLFKQVTDRLALAIISGDIPAGDLIPDERHLGEKISVSRTAYREAVKFLSAKGLIEARRRSGTRVAPASAWSLLDPDLLNWALECQVSDKFLRDLFELRRVIEPSAARLAALRRSGPQLDAIERALIGMETGVPYADDTIRADLAFHGAILDAADNAALSCLKSVIATTLQWSMRMQQDRDAGYFQTALADHRRVFQAIARGDGEQAAAVMTALVIDSLHDTVTSLRARSQRATQPEAAE